MSTKEKGAKSRLCEILGVEEDQIFYYYLKVYRIHNGIRQIRVTDGKWYDDYDEASLIDIINNPEKIVKSKFADERALGILSLLGAKYVSCQEENAVTLWGSRPTREDNGYMMIGKHDNGDGWIALIDGSLFPEIYPMTLYYFDGKQLHRCCDD